MNKVDYRFKLVLWELKINFKERLSATEEKVRFTLKVQEGV